MRKLLSDTQALRQVLEEADALLHMFWRAALPNSEETKQVGNTSESGAREQGKEVKLQLQI